jgi:hypothetical protein
MTGRWQIRGAIVREGAAPLSFGFDIEIPAS